MRKRRRLFSTLAILFLMVHLRSRDCTNMLIKAEAEVSKVQQRIIDLQSFMDASSGVQRKRTGRPLADVYENLHWHDEAMPTSAEERDAENAAIIDDDLPEFTMGPFLEEAFSMSPPLMFVEGAEQSTTQEVFKNTQSPLANLEQFINTLPIHEADLPQAQDRVPKPKTILNINSHEEVKIIRPNPNRNVQQNPKLNPQGVVHQENWAQTKEKNEMSKPKNLNTTAIPPHIVPNNVNVHQTQEQPKYCSWMMLNVFLLLWSIISTIHWLWLFSSKLFRFMPQMDVNVEVKKKGHHSHHPKNYSNVAKMKVKMMNAMAEQRQKQGQNWRDLKGEKMDGKEKLEEERRRRPKPIERNRKTSPKPLINTSTEQSSGSRSSMDEQKIHALSRPVASKTAASSSSRGNQQQQEKMQHRTVINITPSCSEPHPPIGHGRRKGAVVASPRKVQQMHRTQHHHCCPNNDEAETERQRSFDHEMVSERTNREMPQNHQNYHPNLMFY